MGNVIFKQHFDKLIGAGIDAWATAGELPVQFCPDYREESSHPRSHNSIWVFVLSMFDRS